MVHCKALELRGILNVQIPDALLTYYQSGLHLRE
jgi:hypothetical protein